MRHMARFALRGALSGLLCCSPGLLMSFSHLGPSTGVLLWQLIFIWWAPALAMACWSQPRSRSQAADRRLTPPLPSSRASADIWRRF